MCGIAGFFTNQLNIGSNNERSAEFLISKILQDQHTRGPDFQAITQYKGQRSAIILGHNRLKIIDLSDQANQPMWDAAEQYCIVYNGEIYNYRELRDELVTKGFVFNTLSDTEVILNAFKAWGIKSLDRFNGPFAFALFDKQQEKLWLVRDRFGVKPLFYYIENNNLYFASSTKILAQHFKLNPNLEYVARGLRYFVYEDHTDITAYEKLLALPAANYLEVTFDSQNSIKPRLTKYYDLQQGAQVIREQITDLSVPDLLANLFEKLERSVLLRLRADVASGVALSGGLDSSIVASLAVKQHSLLKGFSFSSPENKYSEGPLVNQTSKKINLPIEYVWPTGAEMAQAFLHVLEKQDAPFVSLSVVAQFLLYQKVKQTGIKVLLGGQGGDEVFMGYRKFHLFHLQKLFYKKRYLECCSYLLQVLPLLMAERNLLKTFWSQRQRYLQVESSSNLALPINTPLTLSANNQSELYHRQMLDVTQYSLPTLLRYEDRNSMANSVESRLPFMDYQLIEFGLALPDALKLKNGYGKWCLRQIMHDKIPETIRASRSKRGFDVPFHELGNEIRMLLDEQHSKIKPFLKSKTKITEIYSDNNFRHNPQLMAEAISLLWLSKH